MSEQDDKKPAAKPFAEAVRPRAPIITPALNLGALVARNRPAATPAGGANGATLSARLASAKAKTGIARPAAAPHVQGASAATKLEISEVYTVLGFLIDATGSRVNCWNQTKPMTGAMFEEVGKLEGTRLMTRFITMGGYTYADHGAHTSAESLKLTLDQVRCRSGSTAFVEGLDAFLDTPALRPKIIIVIGDSSEESLLSIKKAALRVKQTGIRIFAFLDTLPVGSASRNEYAGRAALQAMAEITGGKFEMFDNYNRLADLMRATLYTLVYGDTAWDKLLGKQLAALDHQQISGLLTGPANNKGPT